MVRYSVTMDDTLADTIDHAAKLEKKSRSEWITEACEARIAPAAGAGTAGSSLLPSAGPVLDADHHNMGD